MKENTKVSERIIHEIVPGLSRLLERPVMQNQELSEYYYARHVLEQIEIELRTLKKSHGILQERNNELNMQLESLKNNGDQNSAPSHQQQPQPQYHHIVSGIAPQQQHQTHTTADSYYQQQVQQQH